jgi:hypothetical protein
MNGITLGNEEPTGIEIGVCPLDVMTAEELGMEMFKTSSLEV